MITLKCSFAIHIGVLLLLRHDLPLVEHGGHRLLLRRLGIDGQLLRVLVLAEGAQDLDLSPLPGSRLLLGS